MNPQRLFLLAHSKDKAKPPTPEQLAKREQLFGIPLWLSVYGPIMGAPLSCLDNAYTEEYYTLFRGKKYILGLSPFNKGHKPTKRKTIKNNIPKPLLFSLDFIKYF